MNKICPYDPLIYTQLFCCYWIRNYWIRNFFLLLNFIFSYYWIRIFFWKLLLSALTVFHVCFVCWPRSNVYYIGHILEARGETVPNQPSVWAQRREASSSNEGMFHALEEADTAMIKLFTWACMKICQCGIHPQLPLVQGNKALLAGLGP